jgi:hypothetical protein
MPGMSEWTILVYLNAKNNLEPFAFPNFLQMASVGSTAEVKIVLEMGRPKRHYSSRYGAWSKTLRFVVEKGAEPTETNIVADLGDTNMGDVRYLIDFVAWGRKTYPSKRTMLVIWNHGQGWRAPEEDGVPPPPPALPHAGHRYVSNDDDTGDKLYNRAIQDALAAHLAGERLDVVAFDACLMSMIETAYALRGVSKVMVGSEELEPGNGWNYTRWLTRLLAAGGKVEAPELGRLMVQGMKQEYRDTDPTTLSAIDLAQVEPLASAISSFADVAISRLSENLKGLRAARGQCRNYAPGYRLNSIDIGRFMQQLQRDDVEPLLKQHANDVLDRLKAAVIENYASVQRQGQWGSNGLAIYFPANATAYADDPDGAAYAPGNSTFPVEFVDSKSWSKFVRQYLSAGA